MKKARAAMDKNTNIKYYKEPATNYLIKHDTKNHTWQSRVMVHNKWTDWYSIFDSTNFDKYVEKDLESGMLVEITEADLFAILL